MENRQPVAGHKNISLNALVLLILVIAAAAGYTEVARAAKEKELARSAYLEYKAVFQSALNGRPMEERSYSEADFGKYAGILNLAYHYGKRYEALTNETRTRQSALASVILSEEMLQGMAAIYLNQSNLIQSDELNKSFAAKRLEMKDRFIVEARSVPSLTKADLDVLTGAFSRIYQNADVKTGELYGQYIQTLFDVVNYMSLNYTKYTFNNGVIAFYDPGVKALYESYVQQLQSTGAQLFNGENR